MSVRQIKTVALCKICSSPHRADIEVYLEMRSKREKDEHGAAVNLAYVQEKMRGFGVVNPTVENIKIHWKNHCEMVGDEAAIAMQKATQKKADELREGGKHADVDETLRWLVTLGRAEIEERIAAGQRSGISVDHLLKATAELTRRSHSEAQHELLSLIVGGSNIAIEQRKAPKEIPGAEVVEAEAVEE